MKTIPLPVINHSAGIVETRFDSEPKQVVALIALYIGLRCSEQSMVRYLQYAEYAADKL